MTTLQDVARRAGVSMSTASYALSGTRSVTAKTRQRVRAAMAELGYVPNETARSLATRRTRNLALIMPSGFNPLDGTLAAILDSAAKAAVARNYRLSLWPAAQDPADPLAVMQANISGSAQGVILMEVLLDDPRIEWLREAGIPAVLIGRTRSVSDFDCVDIDFERAIRDGIATLHAFGHTNIGLINHSQMSFDVGYGPTRRSFDTFVAELGEAGALAHEFSDESVAGGGAAAERLLARCPQISAVLVMNERASFGVQRFLEAQANLGAPSRSMVTVASSPGVSELARPSFASFDVPAQVLGATAIDRLIDQLEGAVPERPASLHLVECQFVAGDSLRALRS